MNVGVIGRRVEAAAKHVDLSVGDHRRRVVTRLRQRCRLRPPVGRGIVDLMRAHGDAIDAAAADRVDLAVKGDDADRPARPLHPGQRAPPVFHGVVLE